MLYLVNSKKSSTFAGSTLCMNRIRLYETYLTYIILLFVRARTKVQPAHFVKKNLKRVNNRDKVGKREK